MNKLLIIFCSIFLVYACAENKKTDSSTMTTSTESTVASGSETADDSDLEVEDETGEEASGIIDGVNALQVFKQSCSVCHGLDGKLGANGSKDLTQSVLSIEEKINIITNGKGVMTAFGEILEPNEIAAVAKYTEQLKK
jgi:mono/diheme cytochrome c family protein